MRIFLALALLAACKDQPHQDPKAAAHETSAALGDARLAVDQAKATEERLIKIEHDLDALEANMSRVIQALSDAKNDQERDAATRELRSLQQQQRALRDQIEAEKATSAGAGSSR